MLVGRELLAAALSSGRATQLFKTGGLAWVYAACCRSLAKRRAAVPLQRRRQ